MQLNKNALPIKIRILFESTERKSKDFRQSRWYGAIFRAMKQQGFDKPILPFEIKNYITTHEQTLFNEVGRDDTRLGKKIGSHLSQLASAWKILESKKLKDARFKTYTINKECYEALVELIEETFVERSLKEK